MPDNPTEENLQVPSDEDLLELSAAGLTAGADLGPAPLEELADDASATGSHPAAHTMELPSFDSEHDQQDEFAAIELLQDVSLRVKIELGRSRMLVEDVLRLGEGSVVELDKLAGDPVDVYVNERLVARGEVLVLNDSFCVRVNEIISDATQDFQTA